MDGPLRNLLGICGLYCGNCPNYLAPRQGDFATLKALAAEKGISPQEQACDGCLSGRVSGECRICPHGFRDCAQGHEVTWCLECDEFPCRRLEDFRHVHVKDGISRHARVVEDLRSICVSGAKAWLARRAAESACPGCGRRRYWYERACQVCGREAAAFLDEPPA
ncbi:MAG: DUF3795 domain-containing protein [Thermodesulfobacteriota bacterium]